MNQAKRKLKIDLVDLESAFEHHDFSMEMDYFLDLETGEVVLVTGEARRLLEDVYEEYADPDTGEVDWPTILPDLDIPEWQKETLPVADGVEAGFGTRYIRIPQMESYEGYNDMVAFIATVSNPRLQNRLERAIRGKGAFRHFKDVLLNYPQERERWFQFSNERMRQRVLDWLDEEGIEPI
jgi:hypothetical protein